MMSEKHLENLVIAAQEFFQAGGDKEVAMAAISAVAITFRKQRLKYQSPLDGAKSAFRIEEFCRRNSISRAKAYMEIKAGKLAIKKVGSATLITPEAEADWIAQLSSERRGA